MKPTHALATFACLLLALPSWAATRLDREGEFLVRLKSPGDAHAVDAVARDSASDVLGTDRSGWTHLRARSMGSLARSLAADPRVASVEPNYTTRASAAVDVAHETWTPNDVWFSRQWNLASMPRAWYVTRGEASVVVAVLDTGLRVASADAPPLLRPGRDFVNDDLDPDDDNGHGTHIASIIAQATDNALLSASVAPGVSLLPVKVLDASGHGSLSDLIAALYWATDQGAQVINLSVALPPSVVWSEALHDAIAYAAAHDVVLVAAAGNDGGTSVSLPAAFNEVIAVGALHSGGARAAYSNAGSALDLLAPGGDDADRDLDARPDAIVALAFDPETGQDGLYYGIGSSQATAHVSAGAALLLSLGETGRDRIRSLLELTSRHLGTTTAWTAGSGYGALDISAAIAARGTLHTVPEGQLSGFVAGQTGTGVDHGHGLLEPVAVLAAHDGTFLLVLEDGSGVWGLADEGASVSLYRLHGRSLQSVIGGRSERLLDAIERAGSVVDWLHRSGHLEGTVAMSGGLLGMLGGSGSLSGLLESSGLVLVLDRTSETGSLVGLIEGAGGMLGLLDVQGGLVALISSSGGLMGLVQSSGGTLGLVDAAGGLIGLVGSAIDETAFGTPNGLLAAE